MRFAPVGHYVFATNRVLLCSQGTEPGGLIMSRQQCSPWPAPALPLPPARGTGRNEGKPACPSGPVGRRAGARPPGPRARCPQGTNVGKPRNRHSGRRQDSRQPRPPHATVAARPGGTSAHKSRTTYSPGPRSQSTSRAPPLRLLLLPQRHHPTKPAPVPHHRPQKPGSGGPGRPSVRAVGPTTPGGKTVAARQPDARA